MSYQVLSCPHVHSENNTKRIMTDVLIALAPSAVAGVINQGVRALVVILSCVAAAFLTEYLYCLICKKKNSTADLSCVITGLLLAMTLPAIIPFWIAALGAVFAILTVKLLSGGLGKNIFNPALSGRAFLMLAFPYDVTRYALYGQKLSVFSPVDVMSGATSLHEMQFPKLPTATYARMFTGLTSGSIGEASELLLIVGGIYLLWRGVISWRIPVAYIGVTAVLSLVFTCDLPTLPWMLSGIFSGGLFLGAIFMATDYSSSPVTPVGQLVFGAGCGALTVLFRHIGVFPEGVTYAILLMNAAVPLIDRFCAPRRFGEVKGGSI